MKTSRAKMLRGRRSAVWPAIVGLVLAAGAPGLAGGWSPSRPIAVGAGQENIIFAFMLNPGKSEIEGIILADAIRKFGGKTSKAEIWAFVPQAVDKVCEPTRDRLAALGVLVLPFPVDDQALRFPLAAKVYAAAEAEARAEGRTEVLAWLDSDTLVLREPAAWLLPAGKSLGYRPVMHVLIGSPFDRPLDDFWTFVYDRCGVPAERVFPMTTPVDEVRIRPYVNAGMLILRPERGVLRAWENNFDRLYRDPFFEPFYKKDSRYVIFVHQAILAGTILHQLDPKEMTEIPATYNYSLQLHGQYPEQKRIRSFDGLITVRYDQYFYLGENPRWRETVALPEPYRSWLGGHLSILGVKALLYVSPKFGANYFLNRDLFEQYGWRIVLAGPAPTVEPCPFFGGKLGVPPLRPQVLLESVADPSFFDVLAIMPASSAYQPQPFQELIDNGKALETVRKAAGRGVAVSTICSGARVLAAAGVLQGKAIVAEPKFKAEYEASGAIFLGKDHPPSIEGNIVTGARDQYYDFVNVLALATAVENRQPRGPHRNTPAGRFIYGAEARFGGEGVVWARRIGGAGSDGFRAVVEAPDGGFVAAGYTFSHGAGDADILVVKADAEGRLLWTKTFGGAGSEYAFGCMRVAGGYVITGYTTSFGAGSKDVYVVKIDERGDEVWAKTYGGPSWDVGRAAAETADGYLIAGFTHSRGAGEEDVYLLKTDRDGRELWAKTYGGPRSEIGHSVSVQADGGIAVGATTGSFGGGNSDLWLVRTDSAGRELWTKNFGTSMDSPLSEASRSPFDWSGALRPTPDGGFLWTGWTNSRDLMNALVVKTTSGGEPIWTRIFGRSGFYDFAEAAAVLPDGGAVICGVAKSARGDNDVSLLKMGRDGTTVWDKTFPADGSDWASAICLTRDGGFVVVGQTTTGGMMESSDGFIMKVKS